MTTIVRGIASTPAIDHARHSVRAGAFDVTRAVPLLWRHGMSATCGTIIHLGYRGDELHISALVDDDAKAEETQGFSVAFGVVAYEIRNKGRSDYYAEVSQARLDEVSLCLHPVNPACRILSREKIGPAPTTEFLKIGKDAVEKAREIIRVMIETQRTEKVQT